MKKLYFLCTGNSCRSQIAEGFGQKYLADRYEVRSAGVETHGLNPDAVTVMAEVGIDISSYTSKRIDLDYFNAADLIITLCGDARDKCPMIPAGHEHRHWDLPDPARQSLDVFRQVRDDIEQYILALQKEETT
ncbi:MAG: arsenate reductase (thioredoxin) [Streptococcaceae bacterium]|jgi:arsenate reductase|nr:arsenate reductase (thioredoxin) [Streptococcaceae bacterium]